MRDTDFKLTPGEIRVIRVFRSVPEASRPQFFHLMTLICETCDWGAPQGPLKVVTKGGA